MFVDVVVGVGVDVDFAFDVDVGVVVGYDVVVNVIDGCAHF